MNVIKSSASSSHTSNPLLKKQKVEAVNDVPDNGVPTLTPLQDFHAKNEGNKRFAAIVGGVSTTLLVIIIIALLYFCLIRLKRSMRQASDAASTILSPSVELEERRGSLSFGLALSSPYGRRNSRQMTAHEIEQATGNFNKNNIIGEGVFGLVYKGLLQDGSIVVIKRRLGPPTPFFLREAKQIARVRCNHLVELISYCEDSHQQLLVYDYIPNGNVGNHLYDNEGLPAGKLSIQLRLSIALGAAKGLEYLHNLTPPLLHMHFKTSNVLLGDNFVAKVSDFGLSRLITGHDRPGTSSSMEFFLDPELDSSTKFSEKNDVYSYGVFLLELISGQQVHGGIHSCSGENLVFQAKRSNALSELIDKTLGEESLQAARWVMELAVGCLDAGIRRPTMKMIVEELECVGEREIGRLHGEMGEVMETVTLGSELFKF